MARRWQKVTVMKQTDSQQILALLTRLTEELVGPVKGRPRTGTKRALSERVDNLDSKVTGLDKKVTGLDKKLGTSRRNLPIAVQLDALDTKVERRFDSVDRRIDSARKQIVDLVDCVHAEVTGRVIDLEKVGPGRKGNGGRGSGGGGVPLAS